MIPQGTSLVNAAFFTASVDAVNAATSCAALNAASSDAVASLEAEITTVTAQISLLAPLIVSPTDLPSVLTWIGSVIAPMVTTHTNCIAQLAELNTRLTTLTAAIAAKSASLGCP